MQTKDELGYVIDSKIGTEQEVRERADKSILQAESASVAVRTLPKYKNIITINGLDFWVKRVDYKYGEVTLRLVTEKDKEMLKKI